MIAWGHENTMVSNQASATISLALVLCLTVFKEYRGRLMLIYLKSKTEDFYIFLFLYLSILKTTNIKEERM